MPPRRANNKHALPVWPPVLSFPRVSPRQDFPVEVCAMFHIVYASSALQPFTDAEFSRDPNRCMKLLLLFKKTCSSQVRVE
jgi:hypothetical protein